MTDRTPLSCEEVEADLLAGPTEPERARDIATHLAGCASCRASHRILDRDRSALRQYVDTAEWLPVASRVFAALPGQHEPHTTRSTRRRAFVPDTGRVIGGLGARRQRRTGGNAGSRLMAAMRAACLVLIGLGIGFSLHDVWPDLQFGPHSAPDQELAATTRSGYAAQADTASDTTRTSADSAYAPAPADNPPLTVPNSASIISSVQNHATWDSIQADVSRGISPLLYPPIPPSTFDSVVVGSAAPDAFTVRYLGSDMSLVLGAGRSATTVSPTSATTQVAVRGVTGTVTVTTTSTPGQGGLPLDGSAGSALAPGTVIDLTWNEQGLWQNTADGSYATSVPYRVTTAGLPLDIVVAFVNSLAPFGNGWDELRSSVPSGTTLVIPATLPSGFGTPLLSSQAYVSGANGPVLTWSVTYVRASASGADQIVVSSGPPGDVEGTSSRVEVMGTTGTMTAVPASGAASAMTVVDWTLDGTDYRITFSGAGLNEDDIQAVLGGLSASTGQTSSAAPEIPSVSTLNDDRLAA